MIICASDVITFQICSVLSGKLNSPAYLQESKCTSYCLLENASWAVWFFSFQWACCDFVLTDWAVFHFAFIFHPVKRIFSAYFFFPSPASCCLYGSVHSSSDSLSSALLVRSFLCCRGLSWTFPWEAQVKPWLSLWAASSAMGRTCRRGGRTRWASKGENTLSFLYFSLVLCCISSDQPQGACVWLDHLCCSGTAAQRIALPSMLQGMWDGCCSQL